jgi:hypothetical protein
MNWTGEPLSRIRINIMTNVVKTKVTKETVTVRLNNVSLLNHLRPLITELGYKLHEVSSVYVKVPGGGDWSNTNLEINNDCLLFVEIKRETKE